MYSRTLIIKMIVLEARIHLLKNAMVVMYIAIGMSNLGCVLPVCVATVFFLPSLSWFAGS